MSSFQGENLVPFYIGHLFSILSFAAIIMSCIAYSICISKQGSSSVQRYKQLGRAFFYVHFISIVAQFFILGYVLFKHLFEYKYAYLHSDKSLSFSYLLSCFWEGQEGSFLLWMFWQGLLGLILLRKSKEWEIYLMTVLGFVQTILASLLLGVYLFNLKIGLNAFNLLRSEMNWPILLRPDYLIYIKDGTGLNTLLQNYWMVIHPPILFLGYASLVVPFCYAVAGLIKKDTQCLMKVLPYSNFSLSILALGIMMGAAWAYESLSFGGYWAWDPVENASLVPWLVLVAALHSNLIYNKTKKYFHSTIWLYALAYLFVLYASFLTRSGILGDSSVHAFTDLGMNTQLLLLVISVLLFFTLVYIKQNKFFPKLIYSSKENLSSRELWMQLGLLLLFVFALIVIGKTSLPVFNKIFSTHIAAAQDVIYSYNQLAVLVTAVCSCLMAISLFLAYRKTTIKYTWVKRIQVPIGLTLLVYILFIFFTPINYTHKGNFYLYSLYLVLLLSCFNFMLTLWYGIKVLGSRIRLWGGVVAHIGFALVIISVLFSSANQELLSKQIIKTDKGQEMSSGDNITLWENTTTKLGDYVITYLKDSINNYNKKWFYISFKNVYSNDSFILKPNVHKNNKGGEGYSANPDMKHYLYKDLFVYLTSFQDNKAQNRNKSILITLKKKDTIFYSKGFFCLEQVVMNNNSSKDSDRKISFEFRAKNQSGVEFKLNPQLVLSNETWLTQLDSNENEHLAIKFSKIINVEKEIFEFEVFDLNPYWNIITLKIVEYPFINFLWLGVMIMVLGGIITIFYRLQEQRKKINN